MSEHVLQSTRFADVALLGRFERGPQRMRDSLPEFRLVARENVRAGGCNHFSLVNGDIGHGKALDHQPIAGDKARRPSLIIVGAGRYGFSILKNLRKVLTVGDARQKIRHF